MIKITVNGIMHEANSFTISEIVRLYKPKADVFIVNGGIVTGEYSVNDGDEVTLIDKSTPPDIDELTAVIMSRHTPAVHSKLSTATVGVAGLGGLGSPIAIALIRMGIGKLVCVDFDVVEPSNLNRQHYYIDQLGMYKTDALYSTLIRISPLTQLTMHTCKVTANNVYSLFSSCDVLIEAFDNPDAKAMLFNSWQKELNCWYVGASGVAGLDNDPPLQVKKMGQKAFIVGDFTNSARPGMGLMSVRVGVAAHMQANIAVNLILKGKV